MPRFKERSEKKKYKFPQQNYLLTLQTQQGPVCLGRQGKKGLDQMPANLQGAWLGSRTQGLLTYLLSKAAP